MPHARLLLARLAATLLFGLPMVCFAILAMLGLAAISRLLFFGSVDASNLNWAAVGISFWFPINPSQMRCALLRGASMNKGKYPEN